MNPLRIRSAIALFTCAVAACISIPALAQTNTLAITLNLASLPQTITLCRDPNAIATFGIDEQWLVGLDIDNNPATPSGTNAIAGADVLLIAETLPQQPGCSSTSANTAASIVAGVFVWNSTQGNYVDIGQTANVAVDSTANALVITTSVSGVLANLKTSSKLFAISVGGYTPSGTTTPTSAMDITSEIAIDNSTTSPADDVQNCSSPCGTGTSWYPLIDLIGLNSNTTLPLPSGPPPVPPFGANTLDVEFDLASLPTTVSLCNSSIFQTNPGYDLMWIASAHNYNQFPEILIAAHTPFVVTCSPNTANLASSVEATLYRLDPNNSGNGYTAVENLPNVSVDTSSGKIIVQANSTDPNLADIAVGPLSESALENVISSSAGDFSPLGAVAGLANAYPQDQAVQFNFGASFTDPAGDVCTSSSSCTSAAYPITDLIGGSVHKDDWIFRNGFE